MNTDHNERIEKARKRSTIAFLKKINDIEPALIQDIKKQLGITELLVTQDKTTLDAVVTELKKRIAYRLEDNLIPKDKQKILTLEEAREIARKSLEIKPKRKPIRKDTWAFIACIGIYLAIGFIAKFTTWWNIELEWWSTILLIILLIPAGMIALMVQIYPLEYIQNRFTSWGMKKAKAHQVAEGFWICFNIIWILVFFIKWEL